MKKSVLVDTNLFLDDSKILYKLSKEYEKVIIPITVLKELDKHKFIPDTSYSARTAITAIREFRKEYPDKIKFNITEGGLSTNDELIIKAAEEEISDIATKDISMSIIAESRGLKTKVYDVILNNIFKPYIHINMDELFNHIDMDIFSFQQKFEEEDYLEILEVFKSFNKDLVKDSWFFIIIKSDKFDENDKDDIQYCVYANNPLKGELKRIDNNPAYREMKAGETTIKARDVYQACAFYALKEAPNVLLTGCWGSGKSLLGTTYAISASKRKTFITRPPVGINRKYDLGFMPGDKDDKMSDWMSGIMSAMYFIYANTRGQIHKGITYDHVKDRIFREKFETIPVNCIQGLSLLDGDILIVDEVQLLDVNTLSMVLSRPSENGKLILLGDLKQTYDVVKPSESGLLKLLRALPHKSLALVDLQHSYRGEIIAVAEMLQDKTLE